MSRPIRAARWLRLLALVVFFTAAPTAGDIGSCNQDPIDLDPVKFFRAKASIDCARCDECGYQTKACAAACSTPPARAFPKGCYPLVHDGEVCLDALLAASCGAYGVYIDDDAPVVPTECNFCPAEGAR